MVRSPRNRVAGSPWNPATRDAYASVLPARALRSVLARRGHDSLHLGVDGEQLTHGRLGGVRVAGAECVGDPRVMGHGDLGRAVTAGDRAARDLEGGGDDAGEVLEHAIAGELDEEGVELGVSPREGDSVTLSEGMAHDLDHVAEPLLDVLAPVTRGEASGERLDGPPQLAQLPALIVPLRAEGTPFDDVGIQQIPVADRTNPGADIGAGADQALGLENAQGFTDDGAGDLETLADLLGDQRAVGAEVPETII